MSNYRSDLKISFARIGTNLENEFPKATGADRIDSDLMYDLMHLEDLHLLEFGFLRHRQERLGEVIGEDPFARLTPLGIERLREWERPLWKKAIEKQPITFIQLAATLITIALTALNAWLAIRQGGPK